MSFSQYLFASMATPILENRLMETITHYPLNDRNAPGIVEAFVDISQVLGSNERPGDGAIVADVTGDRERLTGHLEVRKSLGVTETDTWLIDGEIWTTIRGEGFDVGDDGKYRGIRITRNIPRRTQHSFLKQNRPVQRS